MPFNIDSTTYADEFNSGTNSQFVGSTVGDTITATIQLTYENVLDASLLPSAQIQATSVGGKQAFDLTSTLPLSNYFDFINEIQDLSGAEITVDGFTGAINGTYTIDLFDGVNIICNEAFVGSKNANNGIIAVTESITSCNLDVRYNGTNSNNNFEPAIEILNSNQAINFKSTSANLDASDTVTVNTIPFTYQSANNSGSLTVRGLGIVNYAQSFEVIHTFDIAPVSIQNDGNGVQPDDFNLPFNKISNPFRVNTGKYGIKGSFGNAVNGGIILPLDTNGVDTDVINENVDYSVFDNKYGGGNTNYSYSNLSIVRTSDSEVTNVPIVQEKFTVSFDVDNATDTPFSNSNTKIKIGIENMVENIDNSLNNQDTFLYDKALTTLGSGAISGEAVGDAASITNYVTTFNSSSSITVSFDVEFSANAITQINLNSVPYFSIFVTTQNHLKDYTDSDRVTLQVFKGVGIQKLLSAPIEVVNTTFITAPFTDWGAGIDSTEIDGFPLQLLAASTRCFANWSGRDNLRIRNVSQNLVLKNSTTLEEIELESENINVQSFPLVSSQYPDINYTKIKGFKIPEDEVRNLVRMFNDGDGGDAHYFQIIFPFFVRWEYYKELILNNVPASILDNTQPFNGKNYFLNRIDSLADWSLNYRINFDSEEDGIEFSQDFDYGIPTDNYNAHSDVTNRSIKSYEEDGVTQLTNGSVDYIDSKDKTLIVVEYTLATAPTSINDFEIEFYIEGFELGSPTKTQRISSVNNLLASSWFTDTGANDGLIEKSISGNKAIGKALIDNNKLVQYEDFRFYPTFYNPPKPSANFVAENSDNLITEDSNNLIIE